MTAIFPAYGLIHIIVIGAYTEEFLTDFMKSGIKVYEIRNNNGAVCMIVRRVDYKKIAKLSRLHHVRVRVTKKNKKRVTNSFISKHSGIICGIIISFLMVILSGKFIFKINVYGADELSEQQIINSLALSGIHIGAYTESIDTDSAEFATKLKLENLSWMNIEINGSRADVYINEGKIIEKPEIDLRTPCNVIAQKDGVIVEMQVYSGTPVYSAGSGVTKGSVIISGVVNDGADNLIITHANGKIIAEFTESVQFRQEFTTIEKKLNRNNEEYEKELYLFGKVIPLTDKVDNIENKVCDEYVEKCKIFGIEMPWSVKINKYSNFENIEVNRTIEDVHRLLQQKLDLYCQNFYYEYEILDVSKNMVYDENGITMNVEIKLLGDIAIQQEIIRKNY